MVAPFNAHTFNNGGILSAPPMGVIEYPTLYQLASGDRLRLSGIPTGRPVRAEVHYLQRVTVMSPNETRKRIFFTPTITPEDGGEPVSATSEPKPKQATVTVLDPTSFKDTDI